MTSVPALPPPPRPRVLALHGEGASGSILRAQLTALARHTALAPHLVYVDAPVPTPPYHGLEAFFPPTHHTYRAWYTSPAPHSIRQAHGHVQALLTPPAPPRSACRSTPSPPPLVQGCNSPPTSNIPAAHEHGEDDDDDEEYYPPGLFIPPRTTSMPLDLYQSDPLGDRIFLRNHFSTSDLGALRLSPLSGAQSTASSNSSSRGSRPSLGTTNVSSGTSSLLTASSSSKSPQHDHSPLPCCRSLSKLQIKKRVSFGPEPEWDDAPPLHVPASPQTRHRTASQLRPALVQSLSRQALVQSLAQWEDDASSAPPVQGDDYDGVICFSQGCAVMAGYLLQRAAAEAIGCVDQMRPLPKFVIFICGSRPFPVRGGAQYGHIESDQIPFMLPGRLISVPTLHLIGRLDRARHEGHKLASLCDPRSCEVVEFDGDHTPPRKQVDLAVIGPAVERLFKRAGVGPWGPSTA